jgi:hypothetical protein
LLLGRFIAERSGDGQPDCGNDCEERNASRCSEASSAKDKQGARVTDLRLVYQRISFDNNKRDSRDQKANGQEPVAQATRSWSAHWGY